MILSGQRIGPTAHYTGYVWARNGLSHPELETREGRVLFDALQPGMLVSRARGGATLEAYLPDMAARKRAALERIGSLGDRHRVVEIDALRDEGPASLAAVAADLDPGQGLAIITEGLLGYLSTDAVAGLWRRFVRTLERFAGGRYISDLHLGGAVTPQVRAFRVLLAAFVRGRVYLHFTDPREAEEALVAAGFRAARVSPAVDVAGEDRERGSRLANILEASINLPPEASTT